MAVVLVALTVCTSQYTPTLSVRLSNLKVAFIFFVGIFYSGGINPLVVAYPVECLHANNRAKGMGLNNFVLNAAEFVNTCATPIGLKNIGWKVTSFTSSGTSFKLSGFISSSSKRGHTLEEMDNIFESDHPVKESLRTTNNVVAMDREDLKV